jgi:hypothetical protein
MFFASETTPQMILPGAADCKILAAQLGLPGSPSNGVNGMFTQLASFPQACL